MLLGDRLSIVLCGWDEPKRFRPVLLMAASSAADGRLSGGQAGAMSAKVARMNDDRALPPQHVPVLVNDVLRWLPPHPDATIVDGTVGLGGHSAALLPRLPSGRLIALD